MNTQRVKDAKKKAETSCCCSLPVAQDRFGWHVAVESQIRRFTKRNGVKAGGTQSMGLRHEMFIRTTN